MIIMREIDGEPFAIELTEQEIIAAHLERQTTLDQYMFENVLADLSDEEIFDCYGVTKEEFTALLPEMVDMWQYKQEVYDYYRREDIEHDTIEQIICDCIEANTID